MPTLDERVAALEAKTQDIHRTVFVDTHTGAAIPGLQINARIGVWSNYWLNQNIGQGAALSIGTAIDRYALYAEIDEESCPDNPSVAVFGSCVPSSPHGQTHIALAGQVGNAGNGTNYAVHMTFSDHMLAFRQEGLEVLGSLASLLVGKVGGVIKSLWP